jgi:hypothetical protein
MRTITTTTDVYTFEELSEESKEKAIENLWDINLNYDWWEFTYDDAENVGIKITGFDIDRGAYCTGKFLWSVFTVATEITNNHGNMCETYKTAKSFLEEREILQAKIDKINETEADNEETEIDNSNSVYDLENEIEELEDEFTKSILEDYRIMLQKEYEYQSSREAIIETIEVNEYEFTVDGELI